MEALPNAQARMWKFGTYLLIDSLRRAMKHPLANATATSNDVTTDAAVSGPADTLRRLLNEHISVSEEFYNSLAITLQRSPKQSAAMAVGEVNAERHDHVHIGVYSCVTALGDLARYRGMFGLASGGEVDTLRRYWMKKARAWYRLAVRLMPENGKAFNQLAILSSGHELEAFYFYSRSLTAKKPFNSAQESLLSLIEANRVWYQSTKTESIAQEVSEFVYLERSLVRLYGILFGETGLSAFDDLLQCTIPGHLCALLAKDTSRHPQSAFWFLFRIAVLNVSMVGLHCVPRSDTEQELQLQQSSAVVGAAQLVFRTAAALWGLQQQQKLRQPVSNGVLVYTLVLLEWLAAADMCGAQSAKPLDATAGSTEISPETSVAWKGAIIREASAGFWKHLVGYLNETWHQLAAANESMHDMLSAQLPLAAAEVIPEDFELQGLPWMDNVLSSATLAAHDITRNRDAEDAVELIDADYGHWAEPFGDYNGGDGNSEPSSGALDDENGISADALLLRRKKRLVQLGYLLAQNVDGLDADIDCYEFHVAAPLPLPDETEDLVKVHHEAASLMAPAQPAGGDLQTNVSPSGEVANDENGEEEDTESSETEDEQISELKARKQELETLLQASRRERDGIHGSRAGDGVRRANAATKAGTVSSNSVAQVKTLLIDTNMFIRDLPMVQRVVDSARWSIVLPLAVVRELDGLQRSPPPLGTAAHDAIAYLEALFAPDKRPSHVRVQTARGNYLPDIQYRSESFDDLDDNVWDNVEDATAVTWQARTAADDASSPMPPVDGGDYAEKRVDRRLRKTLDDVILSVCERHTASGCCLITSDANLRIKAHAHGVPVMSGRDVKHMLRAT
ncbi:hypothetical protein THASP1DRAFT_27136 [Thamnocephalis sphaerospora]|uniref:PIN domain-containing protein n=1 Tax=Thamnocephalis sphaerospora TaxID=78915 RepID=A0A4P9XYC3_9FUNG|nr:hypothetical protein THASP1DRAFT_27136 [Thamnocephalis sphaerospora]|eukprot:RKP11102.1 hypothetical protein THASP1DRAFT_27136 [Thamnocephalis sphaerospora]